ncbi:hypothetical protein GOP47_0028437 [Adiantum capillus-veneris]|nr:hypothetical protein GOP47_0028437 [Adiantum capillus-veneris]
MHWRIAFYCSIKPSSKSLAWKFSLQVEEMGDLVVTKHRKIHSKPGDTGTVEEMEDVTHKETSVAYGCSNGEGSHSGHGESSKSCVDADDVGTSADGTGELNRQGSRSETHKKDGVQELLQLARDVETEEVSQGGSKKKSHSHNEGLKGGDLPESKAVSSSSMKDDAGNHKEGMQVSWSEEARLPGGVLDKESSASYSLSKAKSDLKGDQRSLEDREDLDFGLVHAAVNRRSKRASVASITVGPPRSQFTIPRPFSLATDRRALGGGRARDAENGLMQKTLGMNGTSGDPWSRTAEISKNLGSQLHVEKVVRLESIKHQEDTLKKLSIREPQQQCDEDAMSISSLNSCTLAPKAKASQFTNARSFKFQSEVRAEKRKEYYSKLQERVTAKEEMINQLLAKAQREREEEIKLLRKSLTFKAHPVPSFYQEGPPQKAELPKTPTTRARSPNFTRRESCYGGRLCNIVKCEGDHRSSFSPQKPEKGWNMDLLGHEHGKMSLEGKFSAKSPRKKSAEVSTPSSASTSELLDAEFLVADSQSADMHVKVRDSLIISSELMMSDEEEKIPPAQMMERKHANSNGQNEIYHDEIASMKSSKISADADFFERLDWRGQAANVLQGQVNATAGSVLSTSNKAKTSKKAQPLVHEDDDNSGAKDASESSKKQRYKALTPYFRKHESRRDEGHAAHQWSCSCRIRFNIIPPLSAVSQSSKRGHLSIDGMPSSSSQELLWVFHDSFLCTIVSVQKHKE